VKEQSLSNARSSARDLGIDRDRDQFSDLEEVDLNSALGSGVTAPVKLSHKQMRRRRGRRAIPAKSRAQTPCPYTNFYSSTLAHILEQIVYWV
jgi:hypothetical protein